MTVLGVFFTRGVSLKQWVDSGLFDREVLIYHEQLRTGLFSRIYWFTYGPSDRKLAAHLVSSRRLSDRIEVIQRTAWLGGFGRAASFLYSFLMPLLAIRELNKCDVFKTNQMDGALAAVVAARLLRRPLYVRTGYTLSLFVDRIHARNPLRRRFATFTEIIAFRCCQAASVSSHFDRDYVVKRYSLAERPPFVIGNYIDTEAFKPRPAGEKLNRLIFVGRLTPQKNLGSAIAACAVANVGLDIVGDGPDKKLLEDAANEAGADVRWLGVFPNERLPELLSMYRYFFLPSLWEGMPKALLEAMATGMICIGNDTTGINEVIRDGETGYLATGPAAAKLTDAIRRAMDGDPEPIAAAARDFICRNFSLAAIAAKEREIYASLLSVTRAHSGDCE